MMSDNELELDGKTYVAVDHPESDVECIGCDLYDKRGCFEDEVNCMPDERSDGRNVIFVEKVGR